MWLTIAWKCYLISKAASIPIIPFHTVNTLIWATNWDFLLALAIMKVLATTLCVSLEKMTNWSYRYRITTRISTSGHWCPRAKSAIWLSTSRLSSWLGTEAIMFSPSDTITTPTRWLLPVQSLSCGRLGRHLIAKSWILFPSLVHENFFFYQTCNERHNKKSSFSRETSQ